MSTFGDIAAGVAAVEASEAASAARGARNAAQERLESGANPFFVFNTFEFDTVMPEGSGFWASLFGIGSKVKVGASNRKVSLKRTDISHLGGGTDDFGTPYTKVYLEERSRLYTEDNARLYVVGTLESVQSYINSL